MKNIFLALFLAWIAARTTLSEAGLLHLRAREHFETVQVENLGRSETTRFEGLTNTINYWYEEPFHYLVGLAASPLLATLPVVGSHAAGTGERIRLLHLGMEAKVFIWGPDLPIFTRAGLFSSSLATRDTLGTFHGGSILFGFGYEWNWDGIGIAPEFDWRLGRLNQGVSFKSQGPAIGVHFYKLI